MRPTSLKDVSGWLMQPPAVLHTTYRGRSKASFAQEARDCAAVVEAVLSNLPSEPAPKPLDWSLAELGRCSQCGSRDDLLLVDGAMRCANCTDANHLAAWRDYARARRERIEGSAYG